MLEYMIIKIKALYIRILNIHNSIRQSDLLIFVTNLNYKNITIVTFRYTSISTTVEPVEWFSLKERLLYVSF